MVIPNSKLLSPMILRPSVTVEKLMLGTHKRLTFTGLPSSIKSLLSRMTIIKSLFEVQPPLLVIFGPSGAGKSTLIQKLLDDPKRGSFFSRSVSLTNRKRRDEEEDGVHYHFITEEQMLSLKASGLLLESSVVYGNHYATPTTNIRDIIARGKIAVMDLSEEAIMSIQKMTLNIKYVFITAQPEELKKRLKGRHSEDEHSLKLRLGAAKSQIEFGEKSNLFEKKIVNTDLETAYSELVEFLDIEYDILKN